ncbi:MAG TPA: c-type cytochrome [Burkholderiaceae bacterium]|nr:c-type cytochrome [Burkholderiaceae bacterium]
MRLWLAPAVSLTEAVFRVLPATLAAALAASLAACAGTTPAPVASPAPVALPAPAMRVELVAHPEWWQVRYLPAAQSDAARAGLLEALAGGPQLVRAAARAQDALTPMVLANELRIPVDRAVEVHLRTPAQTLPALDIPAFAGDIRAARDGALVLEAAAPGEYRGACGKGCGALQPRTALRVIALPAAAHQAWLTRQAQPAAPPADAVHAAGHEVFMRAGCGACHAIRGTEARGNSGPDLTHIASRRGAEATDGALTRHHARAPHHDQTRMVLAADEERALGAYLAELR